MSGKVERGWSVAGSTRSRDPITQADLNLVKPLKNPLDHWADLLFWLTLAILSGSCMPFPYAAILYDAMAQDDALASKPGKSGFKV